LLCRGELCGAGVLGKHQVLKLTSVSCLAAGIAGLGLVPVYLFCTAVAMGHSKKERRNRTLDKDFSVCYGNRKETTQHIWKGLVHGSLDIYFQKNI
jgi:hypothetical protein